MGGMGKSPISWRNTFSSDSSQERVWWLEQANFSPAPSSSNLYLISDIPCAYQTPNRPTRHCLHRTILLPPTKDCGTACTASVGRTLPQLLEWGPMPSPKAGWRTGEGRDLLLWAVCMVGRLSILHTRTSPSSLTAWKDIKNSMVFTGFHDVLVAMLEWS